MQLKQRQGMCLWAHAVMQPKGKEPGGEHARKHNPRRKDPMARILLCATLLCAWLTPSQSFSDKFVYVIIDYSICYILIFFINPWNDTLPGKRVLVDRNKSRLFKWHFLAVLSIFLGHPKYPNTVNADWKAHKEDMIHRPKWRGYIRTL